MMNQVADHSVANYLEGSEPYESSNGDSEANNHNLESEQDGS